jgi:hypothetical protein
VYGSGVVFPRGEMQVCVVELVRAVPAVNPVKISSHWVPLVKDTPASVPGLWAEAGPQDQVLTIHRTP